MCISALRISERLLGTLASYQEGCYTAKKEMLPTGNVMHTCKETIYYMLQKRQMNLSLPECFHSCEATPEKCGLIHGLNYNYYGIYICSLYFFR